MRNYSTDFRSPEVAPDRIISREVELRSSAWRGVEFRKTRSFSAAPPPPTLFLSDRKSRVELAAKDLAQILPKFWPKSCIQRGPQFDNSLSSRRFWKPDASAAGFISGRIRVVSQVLAGYLGRYVKGIQKEQLKVGLWNEEILLEKVELILEAFDYLQLPFSFKNGIYFD
ncbi:hypothetical protein IEQ34_012298 [Dendrobium chrysotoxum]|uniref:Uncharacterized protein n=1 Tax=Dendrobium chrysotoxum TaxID=161865 RepID=A0AAV7GVB7_DENCH|nr:hypothetical protein IEQ34_012298 [Dendrobium chrysotoxum]